MVTRIGSPRRKTRQKLSKGVRQKGKIPLSKYFQTFENGDKVKLLAEPAVQKGMYFPRFHGSVGHVNGKQGSCYQVAIKDFNKRKTLVVHPVHLKRM